MALKIEHSQEQREAQGRVIAQVFGLKNSDDIGPDWSLESVDHGDALLKVTLIKRVEYKIANALMNGRDTDTSAEGAQS